jgi:hypothetical protein
MPRGRPTLIKSLFYGEFLVNKFTMASATTMQALNYLGPYQVRVEEVEKPKLEHPDDIIVKVTTVSLPLQHPYCLLGGVLTSDEGCDLWLRLAVSIGGANE